MSGILDFPPPPANPTPGQTFSGPRGVTWLWDGSKWTAGGGPGLSGGGINDAPFDGTVYGRENGDWTNVLPIIGGTMQGQIILLPGVPTNPLQAVTKGYVDDLVNSESLYQGTWQVAANLPNISLGAAVDSTSYLAVTANPTVAEVAPTNIPGIGGQTINNGDRVIWAGPLAIWQLVRGDMLDLQIGDARYLQLAGGIMTGAQYFNNGVPLHFYDTAGAPATIMLQSDDTFVFNTTGAGGQARPLFSIAAHDDASMLNVGPQVQFNDAVWLAADPVALLQAATKRYVDTHISAVAGGLTFIGSIDGSTGTCSFTVASGITTPGPLPDATLYPNTFVVCTNPGTVPSGPASGMQLSSGDWIISDGVFWTQLSIGGAGTLGVDVHLNPTILGADNVQQALQNITTTYLPLTGGTLTGELRIAPNNNLIVGYSAPPVNIGPSQVISPYMVTNWLGFNVYPTNVSGQASYLANGPAAIFYQATDGTLVFAITPSGVAGTPITSSIGPLTVGPTGVVQVGGGMNISNSLSISVGSAGVANILYTVAGVRQWYAGTVNDGTFVIADNSGGTYRQRINLDGSVDLWGPGIRYEFYGGHTFAFLWDGSFAQILVDGGSQGQYAPIGFNDGRYLFRGGDTTAGGFSFGYVTSTGDVHANNDLLANSNVIAQGGVAATNGAVWLTQYGIQFGDFGPHLFSMNWDGRLVNIIVDDSAIIPVMTGSGDFSVHDLTMVNGFLGWLDAGGTFWFVGPADSDPRRKTNAKPAMRFDSLAAIAAIPTHSYDRTDFTKHVEFGFMANEVAEHLPDAVDMLPIWKDEPEGPHLNTAAMMCHAYRALGEVYRRLRALEAKL
jgi:hypothetical protein